MIIINYLAKSVEKKEVEIVERKGKGHPDSLCDGVAEAVAIEIAKIYKEIYGYVLHFNIDKALLVAGKVEKGFGWGRIIKPMELYVGDRATFSLGKKKVDINDIVIKKAKEWFSCLFPHLNIDEVIKVIPVLKEGSEELTALYKNHKQFFAANDTSAAVGYYPLSTTEQVVLSLEKFLNSDEFKKRHSDTGIDVKIMALRIENNLKLTVAMPFLAKLIKSEGDYFARKKEVSKDIMAFLSQYKSYDKVELSFNALDKKKRGINGVYLTLTGTSAEDADSGEVGRGNRANGIIPVTRPIGSEAAAGKNPVSHVGKIYNVFSHYLARILYEKVEEIKEVYVFMLSEIGKPVNKPKIVLVKPLCKNRVAKRSLEKKIKEVVKEELNKMNDFCEKLVVGDFKVY